MIMPALIVLDWGWQRPGVVPAMPGHLLWLLYRYNRIDGSPLGG